MVDQFYALPFFPSKVGNSMTLDILTLGASSRNVKKERGKKRETDSLRQEREQTKTPKKETFGIGTMWQFTQYFHTHYLSFSAIWKESIIVPSF